jgi:two-component system chemotaxis sensor kinase CheA
MSEMDSIVTEFVVEGNEKADEVEKNLIELENDPCSKESLAKVFRAVHTIKGATGFLGFTKLCSLAHCGEGLLVALRDGALVTNTEITGALLSLVDAMREILTEIAATGKEGTADYSVLQETLTRLRKSA